MAAGTPVQSEPGRGREFGALPPIPAMEQPDAVLVGTSESAELLKAIVRRRARKRRQRVGSVYSVAIIVLIALAVLGRFEIAIALIAVIACLGLLHWLRVRPLVRSDLAVIAPAERTLSIRFGPEAFDLQDHDRRVRFPYSGFRAITVESDSITLRMRSIDLAFPRNLFPDNAIDVLRARFARRKDVATLLPLPPLPLPDEPTATMTAGPDTASRLAWAVAWRNARRLSPADIATAAMAMLIVVAIVGKQGLVSGAVAVGAMTLAALAVRATGVMVDFARRRESFAAFAADGDLLATRFGPDAVAVRTSTSYIHERYDQITELTVTREAVLMNHGGRVAAYPRELFPDRATAYLRAAHPRLR